MLLISLTASTGSLPELLQFFSKVPGLLMMTYDFDLLIEVKFFENPDFIQVCSSSDHECSLLKVNN